MATEQSKKKAPTREEIKEKLRNIKRGMRITKVTYTRSVKGRNGDSFVGFSAAWKSSQDDHGGPGADLIPEGADEAAYFERGLSMKDAKLARYMLAMEVDIAALESAVANNSITTDYYADAVRGVKKNYDLLVLREMGVDPNDSNS